MPIQRIQILTEELANQIAAGEVVERPASVVKELVENALDAESRRILIDIEHGGTKKIQVSDDGSGMSRDDAILCLERHATSKISHSEDLFQIKTLGFRGEAIPSISSVSRMEITTRTAEDAVGTYVFVEGGHVRRVEEIGCPQGTAINVEDLFWNTPARKKFLKSQTTELGHITEWVDQVALAHFNVHFQLFHNQRSLCQYAATTDPLVRISAVVQKDLSKDLFPIEAKTEHISFHGFTSKPTHTQTTQKQIYTFLNGRFLKDRLLIHAIVTAYHEVIPKDRFPTVVLYMSVDPEEVDVNVHPQKNEVRFQYPTAIHDAILEAFVNVLRVKRHISFLPSENKIEEPLPESHISPALAPLANTTPVTSLPPQALPSDAQRQRASNPSAQDLFEEIEAYRKKRQRQDGPLASVPILATDDRPKKNDDVAPVQIEFSYPSEPAAQSTIYRSLDLIGQFKNTYLLCQSRERSSGLLMIDQHAAHERVIYERLRNEISQKQIPKQPLLLPLTLHLGLKEAEILNSHLEDIAALGFDIESFSGTSFVVRAVPMLISGCDYHRLFDELIRNLSEISHKEPLERYIERLLATMACHSAIRAGKVLNDQEMKQLLIDLDTTPFATNCPHGRPLFREIELADIEKLFGRR